LTSKWVYRQAVRWLSTTCVAINPLGGQSPINLLLSWPFGAVYSDATCRAVQRRIRSEWTLRLAIIVTNNDE